MKTISRSFVRCFVLKIKTYSIPYNHLLKYDNGRWCIDYRPSDRHVTPFCYARDDDDGDDCQISNRNCWRTYGITSIDGFVFVYFRFASITHPMSIFSGCFQRSSVWHGIRIHQYDCTVRHCVCCTLCGVVFRICKIIMMMMMMEYLYSIMARVSALDSPLSIYLLEILFLFLSLDAIDIDIWHHRCIRCVVALTKQLRWLCNRLHVTHIVRQQHSHNIENEFHIKKTQQSPPPAKRLTGI